MMSNISDTVPFWGTPPASVDWCEKNYQVCHFIAEFWNTVTSSFIAIFGFIGLYLTMRERIERRFQFLYLVIIVVGLGSVAFHGTLQLEYQLLDELPMLWGMLGWVFIILRMQSPRMITQDDRKLALILGIAGTAWSIAAPWVHYHAPIIFQAAFVLLVAFTAYNLHKYYYICKNQTARRLYVIYNTSVIIGAMIWLLDKEACNVLHAMFGDYWWHAYVGSFHGYWHTLMAANVYVGPVFGAIVRTQMLGLQSSVCWWGGIFPFVKQERMVPKLQSGEKSE
jgi:dihydroceramidase